jgi:tetratricopeptide (TPR) repeat protein
LQPDLILATAGVARVAAARGERTDAIAQLRKLTNRIPVPSAVALLSDLEEQQGRSAAAARYAGVVGTIGRLQQAAGQVTDLEMAIFEADHAEDAATAAHALDLARRAYDARPENVFVNDAMAWALYHSGDVDGALPYVDRALRIGTPDALLHYHAAVIFDAAGESDRARAEIASALGRNPWFSFRYHDAAFALATRLGVPESAATR